MDDILVRPLRFDFSRVNESQFVWSESSPEFSIFINALGIHVPYFERFLVQVMRQYRGELTDPNLRRDVQRIIGQESHHAFNFIQWNAAMIRRYPKVEQLAIDAQHYFDSAIKHRSRQFQIGFTAGYETFTFLGGMIILDRYSELMGRADPVMRALWVWHQVEEVEHGAVAFDFYKACYADKEWYRKLMVVYAFLHISWQAIQGFAHMIKVEGYYRKPKRALSAWRFFASFAKDLARAAIPVLSKHYHPRLHPICNEAQNPVAVAWRDYVAKDGDPHWLDEQAVRRLQTD